MKPAGWMNQDAEYRQKKTGDYDMMRVTGTKLATIVLCGTMLLNHPIYAAEAENVLSDTALAGASVAIDEYRQIVDSRVDLKSQGVSMAGAAVALDDYYNAYASGDVSRSVTIALTTMTSIEAASILDSYENLGVANVNNYLNVRKEPKDDGEIIGKMIRQSGCEILGEEGDWYQIKSGPVEGYVAKEYILTGEDAEWAAIENAKLRAVVTTESNLNVRQEPNTESKVLTKICFEERYDVLEEVDGWIKISLEGSDNDGEENYGYISADYADVKYALIEAYEFSPADSGSGLRSNIVNFAMNYLGNRYVWGGTSLTNGTDCSGFVLSVFGHFGIGMPRVSSAQAGVGTQIDSSQMRPGDLIFYSGYGRRIGHVAIYIGNGQIIHAANSRSGIIISRWNYMTPVKIMNVLGN